MITSTDNFIHPTAIVGENVQIGTGNYIGPYCVINNTTLGNNNRFEAFCNVGLPAQYRGISTEVEPHQQVQIGSNNIFSEYVTVSAGTKENTVIKNNCMVLAKAYIAHDCCIGNSVTLSNSVDVAGHCTINDYANLAMGVRVHQFSSIPQGAFIGMGVIVNKDDKLKPFHKYAFTGRKTEFLNTRYFISQKILSQEQINQIINNYEPKNCMLHDNP